MNSSYDDRHLQQLFAEMEPRRRLQAIKGGFRKEANEVRKTAINNLRNSVNSNKSLEKGIRSVVFRRKAGFRITVGTKKANKKGRGEKGFHTNRRGLKKPILIWLESGTRERSTRYRRTGKIKRYGFLSKTLEDVRDRISNNLKNLLTENVVRISKKYGCK